MYECVHESHTARTERGSVGITECCIIIIVCSQCLLSTSSLCIDLRFKIGGFGFMQSWDCVQQTIRNVYGIYVDFQFPDKNVYHSYLHLPYGLLNAFPTYGKQVPILSQLLACESGNVFSKCIND